jgi:hypothetical protein
MSLQLVQELAEQLPARLRDDVVGYARSVQSAVPDIFREANLAQDQSLADQLVFLAGIKKLYAICSGTFWILDSSLQSLQNAEAYEVKIGSMRISRGSREWRQLHDLLNDLDTILVEQRLDEMVDSTSYPEILRRLRDER